MSGAAGEFPTHLVDIEVVDDGIEACIEVVEEIDHLHGKKQKETERDINALPKSRNKTPLLEVRGENSFTYWVNRADRAKETNDCSFDMLTLLKKKGIANITECLVT